MGNICGKGFVLCPCPQLQHHSWWNKNPTHIQILALSLAGWLVTSPQINRKFPKINPLIDQYVVLDFIRRKTHEHTVFLLMIPSGVMMQIKLICWGWKQMKVIRHRWKQMKIIHCRWKHVFFCIVYLASVSLCKPLSGF